MEHKCKIAKMNRMKKIKILLVDNHKFVREGLKHFLEREKDIKVIAETENGQQTLDYLLASHPVPTADIVLLGIDLPDINGIQITHSVKQKNVNVKIILLSTYEDEAHILRAFNAGVDGYILKTMSAQEIVTSIRCVARGEIVVPRSLTSKLISGIRRISREDLKKKIFGITLREVEILNYLAQGMANKEIAANLKTKEKTIKNQLNNIFAKLHVTNRTQAVLKAIKLGIVSTE